MQFEKLIIIRAVIEWDEEAQSYSATCPKLNFVSSLGDTKEDAIALLQLISFPIFQF